MGGTYNIALNTPIFEAFICQVVDVVEQFESKFMVVFCKFDRILAHVVVRALIGVEVGNDLAVTHTKVYQLTVVFLWQSTNF